MIPKYNCDFFKYWWDEELDILKTNSMQSHNQWIEAGKPKHGPIFMQKYQSKSAYKIAIRSKRNNENRCFSNSLHESLLNKDQHGFWRSWKSKFGKKDFRPKKIDDSFDENVIAQKFADFFSNNCCANSKAKSDSMKSIFFHKLKSYSNRPDKTISDVSINNISEIVDSLNKGKAAGIDTLTAEHLQYSHPIVLSILSKLFNLMIAYHHVPNEFGVGITIPIPKSDNKHHSASLCDFRGITISTVISKVFESCLLLSLKEYLISSDRQFGFKSGVGCIDAIYSVRKTIDYFTENLSTVNICTVDLTKAFDRVNYYGLLSKIIDRNVPCSIVFLLLEWFEKSFSKVKWGSALSSSVKLSAGVRQGGILSPLFFAVFVNDVLIKLENSKLGCHIKGKCFNSFMFADDLILLSISLRDAQRLIDICSKEFCDLDLSINLNKSFCLRIGSRYKSDAKPVTLYGSDMHWKNEINYLGIKILAGRKWKINLQVVRQKYFRSLNGLFSKINPNSPPDLLLSLFNSFCVPILMYSLASVQPTKSMYQSLESAYMAAFAKIFKTFDNNILRQCQFFMGYIPFENIWDQARITYLLKLKASSVGTAGFIFRVIGQQELTSLLNKYSIMECPNLITYICKDIISEQFRVSILNSI